MPIIPFLKNKTVIAGPLSEHLQEKMFAQNIKVIDSMKIEELVIYNTIATAEGAIQVAITNREENLHDSKILVLGFGRVAKTLAIKLSGLSKSVACAARKTKDLALIETLGFNVENINYLGPNLYQYDIIINTVPQIILNENNISNIKQSALYIELASDPGGIEPNSIKNKQFKYVSAQGLPGKIAPLASAKYIKQAVYNIIKNNK